jgi:small multidrug resistance family-3 protein
VVIPALPLLKQESAAWLLLPAGASLALFGWLLTLRPTAAGRGTEVAVLVDKVRTTTTDWVGVVVSLAGMAIIMFGPRPDS